MPGAPTPKQTREEQRTDIAARMRSGEITADELRTALLPRSSGDRGIRRMMLLWATGLLAGAVLLALVWHFIAQL